MDEKFHLYERFGVKEYWIVDLAAEYFRQFSLQNSGFYDRGVLFHSASFGEKRIIVGTVGAERIHCQCLGSSVFRSAVDEEKVTGL